MQLFHPDTPKLRAARDRLLTQALRADGAPFPIAAEYPLVLSEAGCHASYCLGEKDAVIAHANLLPRTLVDKERGREIRIGLVGNVATDASHRGQGLMRQLLEEVKARAVAAGLEALVLWSDLLEFYQKLGFTSYGQESRYLFRTASLPRDPRWQPATPVPGDASALAAVLARRFDVPVTLRRSAGEFAALLTIPATDLLRRDHAHGAAESYLLMGKGVDMAGVAHEWGANDPETLLAGLRAAGERRGYAEVMLLAPATLPATWHDALAARAASVSDHAMALAWIAPGAPASVGESLADAFIWGLDSI